MIYQDPKTDWIRTDGVTNDDLNRIEGNIGYLHDEANTHEATIGKLQQSVDNLQVSGIPKLQSYIYDMEATTDDQTVFEIPYKYLDVTTDTVIVYINGFAVPDNYYTITPPVESEGSITSGYITLAFAKPTGTIVKVAIFKNVPVGEEGAVPGSILALNSVPLNRLIDYAPASNPNLLINGDFTNPVNQRGKNIYNEYGKYTIDRWFLASDTNATIEVLSDCIRFKSTDNGSWSNLSTYLEVADIKHLLNKDVTMTLKTKTPTNNVRQLYSSIKGGNQFLGLVFNDDYESRDTFTATFKITDVSNFLQVGCQVKHTAGAYIDIEYIKLELGSVATSFSPRPYGEELTLCQRYYQVTTIPQNVIASDSGQLQLGFNGTPMRIKPTASYKTAAYAHSADTGTKVVTLCSDVDKAETTIDVASWISEGTTLALDIRGLTSSDVGNGQLWTINNSNAASNRLSGFTRVAFDAEIY